jgi:peptidoglycan LD-endopeptidase LytH
MRRPPTIFGPFALAAVLALSYALAQYDQPQREEVQLTKGSKHQRQVQQPRQERRAQRARGGQLIIPVEGISRGELVDTWGQARAEGRSHEGIDILAPAGTRVRAVADGRIVKFFDSVRGGVTIYQFDAQERYVYYYAHLRSRAGGLAEGDDVRQGDVIGYVGATGNANTPHLHFEVQRLGPERQWWVADSVNPYPYLLTGHAPAA